jgi:hypothetical protein
VSRAFYPARHLACVLIVLLLISTARVAAHEGPPYPIVSSHREGPYVVSVWTDPDTTDDGTAGGQFWVMVQQADGSGVPAGTRAAVTVRPLEREGPALDAEAEPVDGDPGRQFAAVVLDHEGWFSVTARVDGPLGSVTVAADVEATYDTRPAPILLIVYLVPFVLVGLMWLRLVRRRRQMAASAGH